MGLFDYFNRDEEVTDDGGKVPAFPEQSGSKDINVDEYIKKKYGLDQKFKQAQDDAATDNKKIGLAEAFGTAFGGANKDNGSFYNALRSQNNQKVAQADADRQNLIKDFAAQRQTKDWEIADASRAEEMDPNSMKSQVARSVAMKFGGDKIIPAEKLQTMSAADIMKNMGFLKDAYEKDLQSSDRQAAAKALAAQRIQDQANKDREFALKEKEFATKTEPKDYNSRLAKLNASDKARFDNVVMATKGIKDMGAALEAGQNTYSLIGDNDFTAAERNFTEALGRMQSGGAINKDEAANFKAMAPKWTDSPEMRQKKLNNLLNEMNSRLGTLGFQSAEVPDIANWKSQVKQNKSGTAMAGPMPKVGQVEDGHQYIGGDPSDPKSWKAVQ